MKPEISTVIETLGDLFFRKNTTTEFLAMRTMEYYIRDLDLLGDNTIAVEIEPQRAYALVPMLRLFDNKSADEIEVALSGMGFTDAEIIASDIEFERWKKPQNDCQ
ncbi:hypothetical protein [Peribacillus simplex]|uniref:hypothetical protein n=1 Tax=Peribacillus simplex TaxID=1478 RepID=UPI0024C164CD|nr:hypothetical protein [Peribacillus simplex]WHY57445.1 hypothetical protein QNH43_03880 [Peribacillus simplex]